MKPKRTRALLDAVQIAYCLGRARADKSGLAQEVFLAAGGELKDWYESGNHRPFMFGLPSDASDAEIAEFAVKEVARARSSGHADEYRAMGRNRDEDKARARVISSRMALALMARVGRPLNQRELIALDLASAFIGLAASESERLTLEADAIERAIELSNGG